VTVPRECGKGRRRLIRFDCKLGFGHQGECSPFTSRLTTREQRGCVCPFPPGCWPIGQRCRSWGTRWHVRGLVRERYEWADVPPLSALSPERRADELARIADELTTARAALRARRVSAASGWAGVS
jgi:hypothetical protein